MPSFAHSPSPPQSEWETLLAHAGGVALEASANAAKFGAGPYGESVGWLHDFGKVDPQFQERLKGSTVAFDHAGPGAAFAVKHYGSIAKLIAPVIAGHHTGLMDAVVDHSGPQSITPLDKRLGGLPQRLDEQIRQAKADGLTLADRLPPPPYRQRPGSGEDAMACLAFSSAFFIRMLFSSLVDADFICTERFYAEKERRLTDAALTDLKSRLDRYLAEKSATAKSNFPGGLNEARSEILSSAQAHARDPQGVFTMTVPTGGGKTLASLSFALDHAVRHNLDRVIVVIPFTSVVEQTAEVFRHALGDHGNVVLEHHGAFDDTKLRQAGVSSSSLEKLRLSQENWDAPIVVTTAVQFFESLFHNKSSRCRKLHNIARSVVILDEAQTLPLPVLRPAVMALDELARNYRVSLVLTTATQPSLIETDDPDRSFKGGFRNPTELMPDVPKLFHILKRVEIDHAGALSDEEIARRMTNGSQALVIVNTRRHARELFDLIRRESGARHLSTMMCAAHRAQTLAGVRAELVAKRPALVVSTSLIEAGVDIDFPTVYRAEAGLDQIAQAAGRCNREGQRGLSESRVTVYEAGEKGRHAEMSQRWAATKAVMRAIETGELKCGLLDPPAIQAYFRELYWVKGEGKLDEYGILDALRKRASTLDLPMEEIARKFSMIDDPSLPILIPFDDKARKAIQALHYADKVGGLARALQRYLVNIPPRDRAALIRRGAAEILQPDTFGDQFVVLTDLDLYRADVGLDASDVTRMASESLVM